MNGALVALCALLTAVTVGRVGVLHAAVFHAAQGAPVAAWSAENLWLSLWYTVPILAILLTHEAGHILVARRHRVRVFGPYLLPIPLGLLASWPFGTLGAFMRLRDRPPSAVAEWDIASTGVIAGAVLSFLCILVGGWWSVPATMPGSVPIWVPSVMEWLSINRGVAWHPLVSAGWVGWIFTAINLIPIRPLDGWRMLDTCPTAWHERRWSLAAVLMVVILCLA